MLYLPFTCFTINGQLLIEPGLALRAGGRGDRPGPPIPWGPIPGIYTVYCVVKSFKQRIVSIVASSGKSSHKIHRGHHVYTVGSASLISCDEL
jgi:hypothetical protein